MHTIPAQELVERAIRNARPTSPGLYPRWSAVGQAFALGSTSAVALCLQHNLDPEELLEGPVCEACMDHYFDGE